MVVSFLQSYFDEIDGLCLHKQYHKAHELYLELYATYSNNIELLNRYGRFLITIQWYQESSQLFSRSLDIDPSQASIYCAMGVALCHMQQFIQALAFYQKAISLNQDLAEAYSNLGATYHALNDFENGYKNCYKAVKIDKNNPIYLSNLANALNVLLRYEQALTFIEQAHRDKPASCAGLPQQGDLLIRTASLRASARHPAAVLGA
jgi:Flp pilus assembly protein TadD